MSEFKKLQIKNKITNDEAAKIYTVSERTITRWRSKEAPGHVLKDLRSLDKSGNNNE